MSITGMTRWPHACHMHHLHRVLAPHSVVKARRCFSCRSAADTAVHHLLQRTEWLLPDPAVQVQGAAVSAAEWRLQLPLLGLS